MDTIKKYIYYINKYFKYGIIHLKYYLFALNAYKFDIKYNLIEILNKALKYFNKAYYILSIIYQNLLTFLIYPKVLYDFNMMINKINYYFSHITKYIDLILFLLNYTVLLTTIL